MSVNRGRPRGKVVTITEEEDVYVSDFDTKELIAELEARGYRVSEGPVDPPSTAASIHSMEQLKAFLSHSYGSPSCPTKT